MIDILIPTFNRKDFLIPNVSFLEDEIAKYNLAGIVKIIVYDNFSEDGTHEHLVANSKLKNTSVFRQKKNVGLELNALSVLNVSESEYVMYLGDDDRIPEGYLKLIADYVSKNLDIGLILPGIFAVFESGENLPVKRAGSKQRIMKPGFNSQLKYAYLAHQLSGCVFKRDGLFAAYEKLGKNKNIYPFIFFALYCQKTYSTLYLPNMKVAVYEGNKKDWGYNNIGLLNEIARNYDAIFEGGCLRVSLCLMYICLKQSWRLRTNSINNHARAIKTLFKTTEICFVFKVAIIPLMLPFLLKNVSLKLFRSANGN